MTGMVLLLLFFLEGITLLALRPMITIHIFIGMLLLPPVALKVFSTGYRFVRYYTGSLSYRRAGPPHPLLRVLGPFLLLTTAGLLGSGVGLLAVGPGNMGIYRRLHTVSFILWFMIMTIHVLAHTWRAAALTGSDLMGRGRNIVSGTRTRRSLVVGALLLGIAIAIAVLPLDSAWVQWAAFFRHDG